MPRDRRNRRAGMNERNGNAGRGRDRLGGTGTPGRGTPGRGTPTRGTPTRGTPARGTPASGGSATPNPLNQRQQLLGTPLSPLTVSSSANLGSTSNNPSVRSVASSSSAGSSSSQALAKIPFLFPKFAASAAARQVSPSVPQQEVLCQRLRQHIDCTLAKQSGDRSIPASLSNYADFYELVHRMTQYRNTRPQVYEVLSEALRDWFNTFAGKLTTQLAGSPKHGVQQNLQPARSLIEYHRHFFGATVQYLAAAYMSAERFEKQNNESPGTMLLHELACHQFVEAILTRPPIRHYLVNLTVVFFSRARQRFQEELLRTIPQPPSPCPGDEWSAFYDHLSKYYHERFLRNASQAEACDLIRALIAMLIDLDRANRSIFASFVEMPLLKRSVTHAQQLSLDQLREANASHSTSAITHYLGWVGMYIRTDRFLLEEQFNFPPKSVHIMKQLLAHWMVIVQMEPAIITNTASGFSALLTRSDLPQLRLLYNQCMWLNELTEERAFLTGLEQHIEKQFDAKRNDLSSKHHFKFRTNMLEYVEEMLSLKARWDTLLVEVFQPLPTASRITQLAFNFFYHSLLIDEGVHQALAYYLHHRMLKTSSVTSKASTGSIMVQVEPLEGKHSKQLGVNRMFTSLPPELRTSLLERSKLTTSQLDRFSQAYHLLGLIQYMKDVNVFYDYTRHYYCSRLLTGSSVLSADQELEYFALLTSEIKRVFVDDPVLINTTSSVSPAQLSLVRKHFTQALNDFKWINSDWKAGGTLGRALTEQSREIESFHILHAGIWKLADYDRCRVPDSIGGSFSGVEQQHHVRWNNKRLLLNTKYSRATISAHLWASQPKPLELKVSLHQLAVLNLFNQDPDKPQAPVLSLEEIISGAGHLKEANTKLALLSLVYGGLLSSHQVDGESGQSKILFELNRRFYDANHIIPGVKDLSALEEHDFWCAKSGDLKTVSLVRALGVADQDLGLAATRSSVLDVGQNSSMILRTTDSAEGGGTSEGEPQGESSTSSLQGSHRLGSSSRGQSPRRSSSASGSSDTRHQAIEREIKIEAAIVRVVKRARHISSANEIYEQVKKALFSGRAPFPPGETLAFEEVSRSILKLVDKKYIKRDHTGGFEFMVD